MGTREPWGRNLGGARGTEPVEPRKPWGRTLEPRSYGDGPRVTREDDLNIQGGNNMIEYRLMTINDYEDAYDLWVKCGNGLNDKDDSREGIEKYLKRNPNTSFVAVLDGNVVGVMLCGHDGRRGIIQHACVSPDCRRMGIGKKLVDLALEALKNEGINKVLLVAFKKNEGGNAFWESQGFTLREDLNYRNKALAEMVRIDPDYL